MKANREYWIEKIEENIARDRRNDMRLEALGWVPVHFWEKEVKEDLTGCIRVIDELSIQHCIDEQPLDLSEDNEIEI